MSLFPETAGLNDLETQPSRHIKFSKNGSAKLKLINKHEKRTILYKVKTTENKRFELLECSGLIGPGESTVVMIKRRGEKSASNSSEEPTKEKFLVQFLFSPSSKGKPWVMWRQANAQEVMCRCKKLVVVPGVASESSVEEEKSGTHSKSHSETPSKSGKLSEDRSGLETGSKSNEKTKSSAESGASAEEEGTTNKSRSFLSQ